MTKPMNKIEKLIEELCPQGVEFKALNEISIISGAGVDKKINHDEKHIKLLNYMDVYRNRYIDCKIPTMEVTASNKKIVQCNILKGDIFFTPTSEVLNDIGNSAVAINDISGTVYSYHIMRIRLNEPVFITAMYINCILESEYVQKQINKNAKGITRFGLTKTQWEKIKIPIPPLTIQKEIVKILDNFTRLEAELEAELEARKKQYDYYREELLSFGDDVEFRALGEVCLSISAGGDLPKKYKKGQRKPTEEFQYPIYSNGSDEKALYGYTDNYKIDNEAVTISARGTIGYHSVRSAKFTPIVRLITLIPSIKIITVKFLNYVLDITEIGHSGGSIPQLTVPNVKKIQIPIPPLSKQKEIVAILDKFDALVNDISTGLPAEITARKKQYEYYRNQLLTFKPLELKDAN